MKLQHIVFLAFLILVYGCDNYRKSNKPSVNVEALTINDENTMNSHQGSFNEFWKSFRQGIITNDTTAIILLTAFPIETRGEMDTDTIVKYKKNEFSKVLNAYLKQPSGIMVGTQFDEILKLEKPNRRDATNDNARVGNLKFDRINGQWKLTFIYLNIRDENFWRR